MKTLKRGVKRGVRVFLPKAFNLFVIFSLLFQPVGSAGIWNVVFAQSMEPTADAVADVPADEPAAEVVPAEESAPATETAQTEETVSATETTSAPTTSTTDTSTEPSASGPSIGDTGATTDTPSNIEETATPPAEEVAPAVIPSETPATNPETPALTEEIIPIETPTETPADTSADTAVTPAVSTDIPASTDVPTKTTSVAPVQEATVTPAQPADETVCLSASVDGDSETNWTINEAKNTAVTNDAVQLGVRYVFPLDKEVTVTFTCLPSDESKRAPLKIERIKASDLRLPNGISILSDYAYDLTTDGMDNGTFKYDLRLPKFEDANANISYIEKSADEVIGKKLTANEVKQIDKSDTDNNKDTVEVSGIDHFTIVFASGPTLCQNDVEGANDKPGQKDLTRMCSDTSSLPTTLRVNWNWDDISWPGGNTGDGCALFDTDNDGKANYSLCATVGGNPAAYISKTMYSCNDTKSDRCGSPNSTIATSASTICEATLQSSDPFPAGDGYPNDTNAACSITMTDISSSSAKLIDVCSYPSGQPNSDPSDCIIATHQNADTGKLEIKKIISPSTDLGRFDLSVDGSVLATGVGNGGTTGEQVVLSANSHTFGEAGNGATSLSNYTTTVSCQDNNGAGSVISTTGSNPWAITVAKDKDIVCTITNTRVNNGSITIIKDAQPDSDQDFAFTSNIPNAQSFFLDDDADGTLSNTKLVSNLAAGTYSVSEAAVPGWTQTSATCTDDSLVSAISLQAGENVICTFTNTKDATLILVKTVTNDNGGTATTADFQGKIDGSNVAWGVAQVVTASSHTASETNLAGYTASVWGGDCTGNGAVTLAAGQNKTCTITNDDQAATLTVVKHVVNDNGGTKNAGNFTMNVTGTDVSSSSFAGSETGTAITLDAGSYSVDENSIFGYAKTLGANCSGTIALGESKICTITNDDNEAVTVIASKIVCDNEEDLPNWGGINHEVIDATTAQAYVDQSDGHCVLASGWDFEWGPFDSGDAGDTYTGPAGGQWNTFGPTAVDGTAAAVIPGTVNLGERLEVREVLKPDYIPFAHSSGGGDVSAEFYCTADTINYDNWEWIHNPQAGTTYYCIAWNVLKTQTHTPRLTIEKWNDSTGAEHPGNTVRYHIRVTAHDNDVRGVHVTDLPPRGFNYVSGSGTGAPFVHEYASPGVWDLGDMTDGQSVELAYDTTISGDQDAGNYRDLAYARGTSEVDDSVIANEPTPFVGTDVEVVLPVASADVALNNIVDRHVDTKTIHKTRHVLGATTTLPSTGANVNTILLALMLLLSGLILLLLGKRSTWNLIRLFSKSMSKAVKVSLFIMLGVLFVSHSVYAANLNVQIETPKAQVSDPNFKIGFVVLDIDGGTPDVICKVNGLPFPAGHIEYTPTAGGNSGNCVVDDTVMTSDGTYAFRVTADSTQSDEVNVTLISGAPSTPLNYSRAAGSCTVSFTTANDGLTDKVELYRSLSSTFTADASTLVATSASIGPNIASTLTDPNGNCGGNYFYAIRAIALSGLGSGFVGDESVVIDNEHKVKTKTTTKKVAGPITTLGAIPVTGGEAPTGVVEGAATDEEVQPSVEEQKQGGSVLGSATEAAGAAAGGLVDWIKSHPWWSSLWLIIIVLIAYFARRMYLGNYNENNPQR